MLSCSDPIKRETCANTDNPPEGIMRSLMTHHIFKSPVVAPSFGQFVSNLKHLIWSSWWMCGMWGNLKNKLSKKWLQHALSTFFPFRKWHCAQNAVLWLANKVQSQGFCIFHVFVGEIIIGANGHVLYIQLGLKSPWKVFECGMSYEQNRVSLLQSPLWLTCVICFVHQLWTRSYAPEHLTFPHLCGPHNHFYRRKKNINESRNKHNMIPIWLVLDFSQQLLSHQ